MPKPNIRNILKDQRNMEGYLFSMDDDSLVWTDGRIILVRNDPNIKGYFGEYILDRFVERGKLYTIDFIQKYNSLVIRGERDDSYSQSIINKSSEWFNDKSKDFMKLKVPDNRVMQDISGAILYCFPIEGVRDITRVNKYYFDYLEDIGFDELQLRQYIHFLKNGETFGILAPFPSLSDEENDLVNGLYFE